MPYPVQDFPLFLSLAVFYVLVLCSGGWLLLPAVRRQQHRRRFHALWAAFSTSLGRSGERIARGSTRMRATLTLHTQALIAFAGRRRHVISICAAILLVPVFVVHMLLPDTAHDFHAPLPFSTDPVIAALLQEERLAAPAPLPPDLFTTKEIERDRHQAASASREWHLLEEDFRQRLLTIYRLMEKHGYRMMLLEGYRSPERQNALAQLGTQVTYAGAYQSYHQYGLAADSAFYRDGKIVISEKDAWAMEGYRLYGHYAEAVGLTWGGKWQMRDLGHVELRRLKVTYKK